MRSRVIPRIDDRPVWSIVCFALSTSARGRGVARALLDAAIEYARNRGAATLEAYPVRLPETWLAMVADPEGHVIGLSQA